MRVYVDRVCREQNIEYCLDSGNVLVLLRHGDFVFWGDGVEKTTKFM